MSKLIFVSLPVADLAKSVAFYEAVGATRNPLFSDATAACMVFSATIHAMLLTHEKFGQFTTRPIADRTTCEVLISISAESRAAVDRMTEAAGPAGGIVDPSPVDEHGFMYGRSFEDPDGHLWGVMWMDMEAAKTALGAAKSDVASV